MSGTKTVSANKFGADIRGSVEHLAETRKLSVIHSE